ncbi:MAG: alpha/beta hydrolase [Armatimonadota bacterium]
MLSIAPSLVLLATTALFTVATAQCRAAGAADDHKSKVEEIPVWAGPAPGSEKWDWSERSVTPNGMPIALDVVKPVLLYYPADRSKAVGTAMVVAPGGGFAGLMMSYEGVDVAKKLNSMGVDAFILKYRLLYTGPGAPTDGDDEPETANAQPRKRTVWGRYKAQKGQDLVEMAVADGQQALSVVRSFASKYGYQPNRVGMIGYSAGGVVTSEAVYGPVASRPDFAAVIYGVGQPHDMPQPAPLLFLAVAGDDTIAYTQTLELFRAYHDGGGKVELHAFQMGAHGFVNKGGGADHYLDRLGEWLKGNNLLTKPKSSAK